MDYEKAFQRSRDDRMRTLFPWLLSGLAAAALLAGVCVLVRRRRRTPAAAAYGPRKRAYVRHILSHPTDGFDDLREPRSTPCCSLRCLFCCCFSLAGWRSGS